MKKAILLCSFVAAIGFVSFTYPGAKSTGAPASSTGAPGEFTCNTVGCHDDELVNQGGARLWLENKELESGIEPGKIYSIKASISRKDTRRFGFELVALTEDGKQAGSFILTDKSRTQIIFNDSELKDREYLTYTYQGTRAFANDLGEWTAQWQSPKKIEGKITFYLAGVAANDDGTDKGDEVFTYQKVILSNETARHLAFPNPFERSVQVLLPTTAEETSVSVWNHSGQRIYTKQALIALGQTLTLELGSDLAKGIYFLQVESSTFKSFQKLIKE
jgi:hypothetical protein